MGDTIQLDETLLDIATDKVDSEVPSEVEGTLVEILFDKDTVVGVGQTIAIIETSSDDVIENQLSPETQEIAAQVTQLEKTVEAAVEVTNTLRAA